MISILHQADYTFFALSVLYFCVQFIAHSDIKLILTHHTSVIYTDLHIFFSSIISQMCLTVKQLCPLHPDDRYIIGI